MYGRVGGTYISLVHTYIHLSYYHSLFLLLFLLLPRTAPTHTRYTLAHISSR